MVAAARSKAERRGVAATFEIGDASAPQLPDGAFDVVVVRHVLWAMPDPDAAVQRWVRLLRSPGRLVLVEGRWHTGGGLPASSTAGIARRCADEVEVRSLDDGRLWGGAVCDERYAVVAHRR